MRPEQKTKSRTKLYNALEGANEITAVGGYTAVADIVFTDNPAEGETFTITGPDGVVDATFTFTATVTTENHVLNTTDLATTGAALVTKMLAHSVTGAWGYLYPDDSVGCDFTTDTLTLTFWPGTWANGIVLTSTGDVTGTPTDGAGGVNAPVISADVNINIIDTTNSAQTKEYYRLPDGNKAGQTAKILAATVVDSDTPTIIGNLSDAGVAQVEALFAAGVDGTSTEFTWTGTSWEQTAEFGTALTFTASA